MREKRIFTIVALTFWMITCFFNILIANRWPVTFSLQRMTFPNVPFPSTFKNSKSSNDWNKKYEEKLIKKYITLYRRNQVRRRSISFHCCVFWFLIQKIKNLSLGHRCPAWKYTVILQFFNLQRAFLKTSESDATKISNLIWVWW